MHFPFMLKHAIAGPVGTRYNKVERFDGTYYVSVVIPVMHAVLSHDSIIRSPA